jgi:serine/threonine-protein kinase
MSPEQAAGKLDELGPASDVYSLGATLYCLLTGQAPFEKGDAGEVLRRVRQGQFPPPRAVKAGMPAALEAVCLKAMALRPADRYGSARELADEVEHWLADEPVAAYREPWSVRLARWGRRHRTLVSGAAALLATAVVGLGLGLAAVEHERRQTAQERDQKEAALLAETRARTLAMGALRQLTDEVVEQQQLARRAQLTEEDRRFLRDIQRQYQEFAALPGDAADQRAIRAEGHFRVGLVRARLGELKEAEAAYREALGLYKQLAADLPGRPEFREHLARSHRNLGNLLMDTGRPKEAEATYADALVIYQVLAADFRDRPEYRQELAGTHNNLGILLKETGRAKEAEAAYRDALDLFRRLAAEFPAVSQYRKGLAFTHNNLGNLLANTGRAKEAEEEYGNALDLHMRLVKDFPGVPQYRHELARTHNNLGFLLANTGRPKEAEAAYRDALAIKKALAADFPAVPEYRRELAGTQHNLGLLLADTGRPREAEAAYADALALRKQLAADFPTVPDYRNEVAATLVNRADLANRRRDFGAARRDLAEALPHHQEALRASATNPTYRQFYRAYLGTLIASYAGSQDQAAAVQAAEKLRDLGWDPAGDAYEAACALAQCIPLVEKDPQADAGRRHQQAQFYGDQALALLRTAVARGYKDAALMKKDTDLDPLRGLDDFKKLLAEVEKVQARDRPQGDRPPK